MKVPSGIKLNQSLAIAGETLKHHFIDTGAPHVVIFANDLPESFSKEIAKKGLADIGRSIAHHRQYEPAGTNVNFVEIIDSGSIRMRTYERGVEDETLACGTGSVASAIVASLVSGLASPVKVHVRSGEVLTIKFDRNVTVIRNVALSGSAMFVFEGSADYDPIGAKITVLPHH